MKKLLATVAMLGLIATVADAANLRLTLSTVGTTDGTTTGAAGVRDLVDPDLGPGAHRLWVWGVATGNAPGNPWAGIEFQLRTTGDVQISGGNFWNHQLLVFPRWAPGSAPVVFGPSGQFYPPGQSGTDNGTTLAAIGGANGVGIGDPNLAPLDSQTNASGTVFGYVDVMGTNGEIHFINVGSATLAGPPSADFVFLGNDDDTGRLAEIVQQAAQIPYDTASYEARITPEPASLLLLGLAGLALRRR